MTFLIATIGNYCNQTRHPEKDPEDTLLSTAQKITFGIDVLLLIALVGFVIFSTINHHSHHILPSNINPIEPGLINPETTYTLGAIAGGIFVVDLISFVAQSFHKYEKLHRNAAIWKEDKLNDPSYD